MTGRPARRLRPPPDDRQPPVRPAGRLVCDVIADQAVAANLDARGLAFLSDLTAVPAAALLAQHDATPDGQTGDVPALTPAQLAAVRRDVIRAGGVPPAGWYQPPEAPPPAGRLLVGDTWLVS